MFNAAVWIASTMEGSTSRKLRGTRFESQHELGLDQDLRQGLGSSFVTILDPVLESLI